MFADWIFFGLAGLSLFVFRRRYPVAGRDPRLFLTPGYPLVPGLFIFVALAIVISVLRSNPAGSLIGVGVLASGVPAYLFWRRSA